MWPNISFTVVVVCEDVDRETRAGCNPQYCSRHVFACADVAAKRVRRETIASNWYVAESLYVVVPLELRFFCMLLQEELVNRAKILCSISNEFNSSLCLLYSSWNSCRVIFGKQWMYTSELEI